jgi:phosphate transport system ATP-binding protein
VFLYLGRVIEYDKTKNIFENPKDELTEKYITGEFG